MFICYKCAVQFGILDELIKHLKYIHFVSSSDTLQCKKDDCHQLFSILKAFKDHIRTVPKLVETTLHRVAKLLLLLM